MDPVLIYDFYEEVRQGEKEGIPIEPYMVVYAYHNRIDDEEEIKSIKDYAKNNGLKTIAIGGSLPWCDEFAVLTPFQVLAYFKNAHCIVTDTFHGSVMSIITNTPFCAMARGNSNKLENLLDEYGLSGRLVQQIEEIQSLSEKEINWIKVNKSIEERKTIGITFIESCLEKCKTWDS